MTHFNGSNVQWSFSPDVSPHGTGVGGGRGWWNGTLTVEGGARARRKES